LANPSLIHLLNGLVLTEKIEVDFFYSSVDFASQAVRKELDSIAQELNPNCVERHDYDYLAPTGKRIAEKKMVQFVPAVVINNEEPSRIPVE